MSRSESAAVAAAARLLGPLAQRDAPLGARTTYRVGGTAALFVEVDGEPALEQVCAAVAATGVEVLVVGNGSNLLVADAGFDGLAVHLGEAYGFLDLAGETARAGGGLAYPLLARRSASAGLAGMEWAVGIPGTVGGAVRMNAGGHGAETKDRLVDAVVVDLAAPEPSPSRRGGAALDFSYRHSALAAHDLVLEATFALEQGDAAQSGGRIAEIVRWRREHQPGGQNAGSVFTNPPGDSAGRLVDSTGLSGLRIGSAAVSEKHANFIQADPGGSADDVLAVIEEVRRLVAERTGITLETELRLVGF